MDENKNKNAQSDGLEDELLVFRREPSSKPRTQPAMPPRAPQSAPRTQAVPPRAPANTPHNARAQGGAVVRPLKKGNTSPGVQIPRQQAPTPTRSTQGATGARQPVNTPSANSQRPVQRPVQSGIQNPARTTQIPSVQNQRTRLGIETSQIRNSSSNVPPHTSSRRRSENDDFEIDEVMTNTRQTRAVKQDGAFVDSATSAIMSLVKAVVYIIAVIIVSVGISLFAINTANDVFKFVVDEKIVTVEIPEYATIDDVTDALHKAGAIKYKWSFKLWSELKDSGAEFIPGTYEVSTSLNYDYLRASFKENKNKFTEVRIAIPEGYTVDEIIDLFVDQGIGTREGFVDAIQNYDFEYRFLEGLEVSPDRIYRLEGYLFPDTYYFYKESSEPTILKKMLDNFNRKFVEEYYARCQQLGITVDEAITLASMLEKETRYADELGAVSSVFHNRLNNPGSFPYLNSDATIMYAMQHDLGGRPDGMTGEDTQYDTPYNTYTYKGLPPGPIANPGLNSIKYALYPNKTNYYYFVSDASGRTLFATTEREHLANINTVRGN